MNQLIFKNINKNNKMNQPLYHWTNESKWAFRLKTDMKYDPRSPVGVTDP